jgi:ACS family pantothenate transporter-like MFS transporter
MKFTLMQHTHRQTRQEDLGLYGNQLNYMQTCWTVGYVIGEIPSNILLTKIRPSYWLPALEVRG